jgi:hypothetical protein
MMVAVAGAPESRSRALRRASGKLMTVPIQSPLCAPPDLLKVEARAAVTPADTAGAGLGVDRTTSWLTLR